MGNFNISIDAAGAHGCNREILNGGKTLGCGRMSCPDCIARNFVEELKRRGVMVNAAILTHWPGTKEEVKDDLLTGIRAGHF
jgi:hypothetical protein